MSVMKAATECPFHAVDSNAIIPNHPTRPCIPMDVHINQNKSIVVPGVSPQTTRRNLQGHTTCSTTPVVSIDCRVGNSSIVACHGSSKLPKFLSTRPQRPTLSPPMSRVLWNKRWIYRRYSTPFPSIGYWKFRLVICAGQIAGPSFPSRLFCWMDNKESSIKNQLLPSNRRQTTGNVPNYSFRRRPTHDTSLSLSWDKTPNTGEATMVQKLPRYRLDY